MNEKPVVLRRRGTADVDEAIDYYLQQGSPASARGMVGALERGVRHIGRYPTSGSNRYAHELDLPGLRHWALRRYPYLVFYVERASHIDVWRVLHAERDLPAWMRDQGEDG